MIKILAGIAYEQTQPTGVASALIVRFSFLPKSALKNALYKKKFQTKVVTNHNAQLTMQKLFGSPYGCGLCPDSTIRFFFGEKCLKNSLYKIFERKVVTNLNLQLLCCVTFFDISHHYGVIAASQICSVSRKYCAVLWNKILIQMCIGLYL